jgi:hypothetical protein
MAICSRSECKPDWAKRARYASGVVGAEAQDLIDFTVYMACDASAILLARAKTSDGVTG